MSSEQMERELLELAAKAAGIDAKWRAYDAFHLYPMALPNGQAWNPLTDDGDALRLAVKLGMTVTQHPHAASAQVGKVDCTELFQDRSLPFDVLCESTRRAIVRAAAQLAKGAEK
jgi:hypothetical protein